MDAKKWKTGTGEIMAADPWKVISIEPVGKVSQKPGQVQSDDVVNDHWRIASQGEAKQLQWSDVPGKALKSAPSSAGHLIKNIYDVVTSPIQTVKGAIDIGAGALQNILPQSVVDFVNKSETPTALAAGQRARESADVAGQMLRQRYGGFEQLKTTLATDPVGAASDLAAVLSGGGGLVAKVPGVVGRAGAAVAQAGSAIDPLVNALKVAKSGAALLAPALGFTTGAGPIAIREAYKAGVSGSPTAEAFKGQIRGTSPVNDVVETAKTALENMRKERSTAYKEGMFSPTGVTSDKTVLNFNPIEIAVADVQKMGNYKGKVIDSSAAETWKKINDVVTDWKASDPKQFHTPEGLDALKKAVGDIRDSAPFGTPSRVAADRVYNSVKDQIVSQAPEYGRVMKEYEQASALLKEMETSLSVNPKANIDTTVRKLQSILRNNANTNYGRRVELGQILAGQGAENLFAQLAGQALSTPTPRSLQGIGSAIGGGMHALTNPATAPMLALTSPRAMGEASYAAGSGVRLADQLRNKLPTSPISAMDAARIAQQLQRWQQQGAQQ